MQIHCYLLDGKMSGALANLFLFEKCEKLFQQKIASCQHTLNATANATLFKVLFPGNSLRYLFVILDFEVWRLFALRNGKNIHP